jgi:hypothetical protein
MNAAIMSFGTLQYSKKLIAVGVTPMQAEVHAEAIKELIDDKLVTKKDSKESESTLRRDFKELELALKRDLKEFEIANKRDFQELELRITIKLGGIVITGISLLVILMKIFNL